MSQANLPAAPYKGLMPYSEEDAPYFFGRAQESEIITANLMASRLTLLYGASGVGKSSVLRAGVAYHLRQLAHQTMAEHGRPDFASVVFSSWRDDPLAALSRQIVEAFRETTGEESSGTAAQSDGLLGTLEGWTKKIDGELLVILDQFEEYFLYHEQEEGPGTFAFEFPQAINEPGLRVNFLISIREDALARLDRFKGRIPNLFENYLRVEHLGLEAAREAITGPLERYNSLSPTPDRKVSIEPELMEAVLNQVQTGRFALGEAGRGIIEREKTKTQIETPFLQLVMTRLWEDEMKAGSRILHYNTLKELGGAERIVRTHLDDTMSTLSPDEQYVAARIFHYLVTPSGSKIAHGARDLAFFTLLPVPKLKNVLEKLSVGGMRILRPVATATDPEAPRYEIFHDVLAVAIMDWRARFMQLQEWTETQEQLERERRRVTFLRAFLIAVSLAFIVLVLYGINIYRKYNRSLNNERMASSRELAFNAENKLSTDPELSVLLATEAARIFPTTEAAQALRTSLRAYEDISPLLNTLVGHKGSLSSVAFSPDGKFIVTASWDRTARIWDVSKGETVRELRGHGDYLSSAAYSLDGKLIVTASGDGTVRVWDAETGQNVAGFKEHSRVNGAEFSPDGKLVVTANADNTARIWEVSTGKAIRVLNKHTGPVASASFSPDGKFIVTASQDFTARIWVSANGEPVGEPLLNTNYVMSAAYSPDGKFIVTADGYGMISIWDASNGKKLGDSIFNRSTVESVAYSPDGKFILTASRDRTARIWDVETRQLKFDLPGHTDIMSDAVFSPDGKLIVTASRDYTAKIWSARERPKPSFPLEASADDLIKATFSPDRAFIVTTSHDYISRIWKVSSGENVMSLRGHTGWVTSAVYSPDGKLVVTASADDTARVWDAGTGQLLHELKGHSEDVNGASFSPDGKFIVTASDDHTAKLWDAYTGQMVGEWRAPDGLSGASFSPDGKFIVTSSWAKKAWVWDVGSKEMVSTLEGHAGRVNTAMFSPDGRNIVTASDDTTTRVWDANTGKEIVMLSRPHMDWINGASFSPDGELIITASQDKTARVWRWRDEEDRKTPVLLWEFTGGVNSAAFSSDGKYVVTVSRDNTAYIFPWVTFAPVPDLLQSVEKRFNRQLTSYECEYLHDRCQDYMRRTKSK